MGDYWSKMAYHRRYIRSLSWSSNRGYEVRGLFNDGLSCCVNALLQSFSATTELLDILNKWNPSDGIEQSNIPLQLRNTLLSVRDPSHSAPHKGFLDCLYRHAICRYTQQDADEIFHMILNLSLKQMPDHELAQEISSLYTIEVETQVTCMDCTFIHRVPNLYFSFPLVIHEGENTLESCIISFFKKQKLEVSEKFFCDRCEKKQPCAYEQKLVSLPQILCVHLKRFRNEHGLIKKLDSKVTFPETLKMSMFAAGQSENAASDSPQADYSLFAVIVHIGSAMFGHYTAFIRQTQDQMWYYANDSRVNQATWKDVQDTYKGRETAYLLLYRKKSLDSSG